MKPFYFILLFIPLVSFSQMTYVPDDNFEWAIIYSGLDTGYINDSVPTSFIDTVTSLNIIQKNIYDITGIESFSSLERLDCSFNSLDSLNLSQNLNLKELTAVASSLNRVYLLNNKNLRVLNLSSNLLDFLDLKGNSNLIDLIVSWNNLDSLNLDSCFFIKNIFCSNNNLIEINLDSLFYLEKLNCSNNNLSNIKTTNNNLLYEIYCNDNIIDSIDFSQNKLLKRIGCSNNQIEELITINLDSLEYVSCNKNNIESLDFSSNQSLKGLDCSENQLTSLNIKNGNDSILTSLYAQDNPDLGCILSNGNINNLNIDPQSFLSLYCVPELYTDIPDDNFELALNDLGLDDGIYDNRVLTSRIDTIKTLNVIQKIIFDLKGIEDFKALEKLYCSSNYLLKLDVSQNENLKLLWCNHNSIKKLDLNENSQLETLWCNDNDLKELKLKNGNNSTFENDTIVGPVTFISFRTENNPRLRCIEVDNPEWSSINWTSIDDSAIFTSSFIDCQSPPTQIEELNKGLVQIHGSILETELVFNTEQKVEFSLFDLNGRKLIEGNSQLGLNKISLSPFSKGIYFIKFSKEQSFQTFKIIKK